MRLLLLLHVAPALAVPADWFLDASLTWKEVGANHSWFEIVDIRFENLRGGGAGTDFRRLLPEVYSLRHAWVALRAVPEEQEAKRAVRRAHRQAMEGKAGASALLATPLLQRALRRASGREVPVDVADVPRLKRPGRFKGRSVGLGLGQCDINEACDPVAKFGQEGEKLAQAIGAGGVRFLDSAYLYGSDGYLGKAWRASGVPRGELFLMTKLKPSDFVEGREEPADSFEEQLRALDTDYVDALLFHHESRGEQYVWKTIRRLEKLQDEGKARAIGFSDVPTFRTYKRCVKAGRCRQQRVILQLEAGVCAHASHSWHSEGFLKVLQDDEVEVVQHTAWFCQDEPVVAMLAEELGASFYTTTLQWMQRTGAAALVQTLKREHIAGAVAMNRGPATHMDSEHEAMLWGLSLIYSFSFCEGSCHRRDQVQTRWEGWCTRDKFARELLFDPLGLRELFRGTAAPCVGSRPDWAGEEL